jgi:hypothetical protein
VAGCWKRAPLLLQPLVPFFAFAALILWVGRRAVPCHVCYLSLMIAEHRSTHSALLLLNTQPIKFLGSLIRNIRSLRSLKSSSVRRDSQLRGLSRLPLTLIQPNSRSIRLFTPLCSTFTDGQVIIYAISSTLDGIVDTTHRFSSSSQTLAALNHGLCPMEMPPAAGTRAFSSPCWLPKEQGPFSWSTH